MATEICQMKDETVLKTAGKWCNRGEVGHMYILHCEVAQQTKFVIGEAGGSPHTHALKDYSLLGIAGILQKACPQGPPEIGRARLAQRQQPGEESSAEGTRATPTVL